MQGGSPCAGLGERVLPLLGTNGEPGRCRAFGGGGSAAGAYREGLEIKKALPCPLDTAAFLVGVRF